VYQKASKIKGYLFDTDKKDVQVSLGDLLTDKPILLVLLRHLG
jgi:hypothetical protein